MPIVVAIIKIRGCCILPDKSEQDKDYIAHQVSKGMEEREEKNSVIGCIGLLALVLGFTIGCFTSFTIGVIATIILVYLSFKLSNKIENS